MKDVVVSCPHCRALNRIEVRLIYDGGDHMFECHKCGEPLIDFV